MIGKRGNQMKRVSLFLILSLFTLAGCTKTTDNEIRIAKQFGLAYAPIEIMQKQEILEDQGYQVTYVKASNTANIRELILAGQLDVGFMAIPPFLIGYDNKMEWKTFSGLSSVRVGLTSYKDYQSIGDITATDRIALPQAGSIQHILLAMASEREFGDASKFDKQLVSLNHADGYTALLSKGDISLHFTSEPYLTKEIEAGNNLVIDGASAMGSDFTFIIGATTNDFYNNTKAYSDFYEAYQKAIAYINNNKEEASSYLAQIYDISTEEMLAYLQSSNISYTNDIKGYQKFYDFMVENNYLNTEFTLADTLVDGIEYE